MQARPGDIYSFIIRDDAGNAEEDDLETGFFTPDTRLIFDGSVVSPDTTYKIELYFDSNGDVGLMDAFLNHDFGNGTAGRIGQFTAPVTRESMVEDNQLQTIERTPTDWVFSAGQVQGAAISFTDEANSYRVTGSLNDGARTGNSPYNLTQLRYVATNKYESALNYYRIHDSVNICNIIVFIN